MTVLGQTKNGKFFFKTKPIMWNFYFCVIRKKKLFKKEFMIDRFIIGTRVHFNRSGTCLYTDLRTSIDTYV